jgi:mannose-6-phosphate isomerase-like protein (cupin superfamily)
LNVDDKFIKLKSHQSFSPDAGKSVKLENKSKTPLVFIEVATGIDPEKDHFNAHC